MYIYSPQLVIALLNSVQSYCLFPFPHPALFPSFAPPPLHSPGGAQVQAQPHQPDSECDRVSADGVRRGGQTSAAPLLVQRQPASPPNVRCMNTPTQGMRAFTQQCSRPPAKPSQHTLTYRQLLAKPVSSHDVILLRLHPSVIWGKRAETISFVNIYSHNFWQMSFFFPVARSLSWWMAIQLLKASRGGHSHRYTTTHQPTHAPLLLIKRVKQNQWHL